MRTCIYITYNWIKSTLIWICLLLHNLRGRTVDGAPLSVISLSNVVAVENSPVSNSPEQTNSTLLSNKTGRNNNTMVSLDPAKLSTRKEISSDLNFTASGNISTLENASPVKPLVKKQKPIQANIETVLNITQASFYDLSDFQNDSEEYDPLFAYKTKRGLGKPGDNSTEVPNTQTSNASDFTSSPTLVTETTTLIPPESKTETTTASGSVTEKAIEETTIPVPPPATDQNEPTNDIKSEKRIKSTQLNPSADQPKNETGTQSGFDETTTQKEPENKTGEASNTNEDKKESTNETGTQSGVGETTTQNELENKTTKESNTNEDKTEAESTRNSDKEIEGITPGNDNGNTTAGTDDTPIVEYENDPKWYGNPKTIIVDYYEVFKQRGCIDFSCVHDFE